MQFKGLHWIEASAGTGKTYTLSSLMVRIFLKDYLPNQVIATTFTRAAAAELKSRIRARLLETQQYIDQCLNQSLDQRALAEKIAQLQDPLLKHILQKYRLKLDYASSRLKLVSAQLDELFVGTLDSFSQKLLREFSFESGKIERANITDQASVYTEQLLHDVLREWIQAQPQHVVDYMLLCGRLKSAADYEGLVNTSLNFASAEIQGIDQAQLEVQDLAEALQNLASITMTQIEELKEYYDGEYSFNFSHYVAGSDKKKLHPLFTVTLPKLIEMLQHNPLEQYFNLHLSDGFNEVLGLYLTAEGKPRSAIFNKAKAPCTQDVQDAFFDHPVIRKIKAVADAKLQFESQIDLVDTNLKIYLVQRVKQRLPQLLQQKGETTFAQQIRTLAEALHGERGQRFAQFVHTRYPLILVDEFQDTNQDQDDMLSQIWRNPKWYARGCMIMVGDPKQAIYGFRGGDMLTYNNARDDVLKKQGRIYSLRQNHRSVKELVSVVDELFQRQPAFGEKVIYDPVIAGSRPHPALMDRQQANPAPLRWVTVEHDQDESIQIARKIRELLNQGIAGDLYFDHSSGKVALQADDIAILSTSHQKLDQAQYELERIGIQVNRSSQRSVFTGFLAKDVAAILTAILHPYDEAKVKRALLTRLLGYNLQQLIELEQQGLGQFIYDFDCIREMWVNKGFLTAWNYCLNLFKIWENLVAKRSFDNERHVVNLRHLTELLSRQSERHQGAYMLYYWYLQQVESPAKRDWEIERKLSNAAGVKLMTIHQSKGLEFKVVFLMSADQPPKSDKSALVFATQEEQGIEQRIIAIKHKDIDATAMQQHSERRLAELNRLWYVALTRASYRVYAMLKQPTPAKEGKKEAAPKSAGLNVWRLQAPSSAEIAAAWSCDEAPLTQLAAALQLEQVQEIKIEAADFPQRRFYPRTKTSFSGLAQHLPAAMRSDTLALASEEQAAAADEINQEPVETEQEIVQVAQPIAWIKANFQRGTQAGSFLHKLFEYIDFQASHDDIFEEVKRRFHNDKEFNSDVLLVDLIAKLDTAKGSATVQEADIFAHMTEWLKDVLNTPLHDTFQLSALSTAHYLSEFPFYLALADQRLFIQAIQQLFEDAGHPIQDLNEAATARYLTGSIDLVYFDGQCYHIADYKSNYLGADQRDYEKTNLEHKMTQSSYWLQAALYLVALHRYLSSRLQNYDIRQHLGGASYLYLRGMQGQAGQGVCHWRPDAEFILQLDQILGYFELKK
ncbi:MULTISPECIES: UvrD-helicase domain-containing protein [unclassified Acinetobacter]|uniref:UvrD-helicase domain-containing protein n=1 Tax=unclassified Acinetobacter TaxID=196816 RepID=UPI0015D24021|nr:MULTISPECIES: UvrD-helicase domain-containing protein [unclassified Acinetobacter]